MATPLSDKPLDPRAGQTLTRSPLTGSASHDVASLDLHFATATDATRYAISLASLLFSAAQLVRASFLNRSPREDLDPQELSHHLTRGHLTSLRFAISRLAPPNVELTLSDLASARLTLSLPLDPARPTTRLWLQRDPDLDAPLPALALPSTDTSLTPDAAHALIGLASRSGGFASATLSSPALTWSSTRPDGPAKPLHSTHSDTTWAPTSSPDAPAEIWVSSRSPHENPAPAAPSAPTRAWWDQLNILVRDAANTLPGLSRNATLEALHTHLSGHLDLAFPWALIPLVEAPPATFAVAASTDTVARLIPEPDRVLVALDLTQPTTTVIDLLLHACAHLALVHIRPGDPFGHWDTASSLSSPHRHWDREAQAFLDEHLPRPDRRVSSLAECTPRDKAWLVLHDHIGRMVGESRTLHESAEHYQPAAYQRQAAQRLVAQLEEYGGAMLCDGVGLGKTYVATTVLVHYMNTWRDRCATQLVSLADDPLRVTILAPNSVVSTWEREALPPLAIHGVPLANVRVLSHTKLSRIVATSDILLRSRGGLSDIEHLLLSDLVIVDEAHNFRSIGSRRTAVLRDLLRLQPRRDLRRKVLLLTATPVNNSLEDLRQQAALMFGKALWFNDELTPAKYHARAIKDVDDRVTKAAQSRGTDISAALIHGDANATFSNAIHFRDDIAFGVQVPRVGDYLKEQEKKLATQQALVRAAIQTGQPPREGPTRIAADLLDRIVVQRSRALCKQIELEHGSSARLLFRPDAPAPEKVIYEDVYDDTRDVLARFLPLFDTQNSSLNRPSSTSSQPAPASLSLKVHMWADVRDGLRKANELTSVVGLQRVLVLKRLESSPVAFLITLLRLLALHASRLYELVELCRALGDKGRAQTLLTEIGNLLDLLPKVDRDHLDLLITGHRSGPTTADLLGAWRAAHIGAKASAASDDPLPPQLDLFEREDDKAAKRKEQLDRLWDLREDLTRDLATLLHTAPGLADIVFGRFAEADWPKRFIMGGHDIEWPQSAAWAMRIVNDAKLRHLIGRLIRARADGQKVIVFSQFTDTLIYIDSVIRAATSLNRHEWNTVLRELSAAARVPVSQDDVLTLVARTAVVTGDTEDRDAAINAFAPFYRLGPTRPSTIAATTTQDTLAERWVSGWTQALRTPVDVLLATDVLAEGVNLQDAALLINFDVHWNPVRMIQRAGRIDRRLNPAIEDTQHFPDLEALAQRLGVKPPRYWWHTHPRAAPRTANLLLPDELERELQLRERIANKTLAIDFTLGLDQGTGAEADWMADYRYRGISALNAWQGDRAIEQIASYQQRLRRLMNERGIDPSWVGSWNGWLRELGAAADTPLIAWARLGRKGGTTAEYTRQLRPKVVDGVPHWLWTTAKPTDSLVNFWLALDAKTFPAGTRSDLPYSDDASRPISADDLLGVARRLLEEDTAMFELGPEIGLPILQGATAIAAAFLSTEADRRAIHIAGFRLLQLTPRAAQPPSMAQPERRGIARPCPTCAHPAGMHKCCPTCGTTATGEAEVDRLFGFRRMSRTNGAPYEIPQTWCRACRNLERATQPNTDTDE